MIVLQHNKKISLFFVIVISILTVSTIYKVDADTYTSKTQLITNFKNLANNYNGIYESIGKTTNNNDIYAFYYGTNTKPQIMIISTMHGDEIYSTISLYSSMYWLLTANTLETKTILSSCQIVLVPILNVDSSTRKNSRGVDLNRNFVYHWSQAGSTNPTSDNYKGTSASSEDETKVINAFIHIKSPSLLINLHDWGGDYVLYSTINTTKNIEHTTFYNTYHSIIDDSGYELFGLYTTSNPAGYLIGDSCYYYDIPSFLIECSNNTHPSMTELQTTKRYKIDVLFEAFNTLYGDSSPITPPIIPEIPDFSEFLPSIISIAMISLIIGILERKRY